MGTIVQFDTQRPSARRPAPEKPCVITIFPGVRYERHVPAPAQAAATAHRVAPVQEENAR